MCSIKIELLFIQLYLADMHIRLMQIGQIQLLRIKMDQPEVSSYPSRSFRLYIECPNRVLVQGL